MLDASIVLPPALLDPPTASLNAIALRRVASAMCAVGVLYTSAAGLLPLLVELLLLVQSVGA